MSKYLFFTLIFFMSIKTKAQHVAVAADKMNVFYIGIANPITIAVGGVSNDKINVTASGGDIQKAQDDTYIVTVSRPGKMTIYVEWNGKKEAHEYRVKAMPMPEGVLKKVGNSRPEGVVTLYKNYDFDVRCTISSYHIMYIPKNGDAIDLYNEGADFNAKNKEVMQRAKIGDVFQFQIIKLKCPWDCGVPNVPPINYVVKN
jgi:GldM C-terminal domain